MKTNSVFKLCLSLYFFIGGLFFLVFFVYQNGMLGLLNTLLPSFFTILILLFFCVGGGYATFKKDSKTSYQILTACLLLQSIQVNILGLVFKNYYGPYLGIGFTDTPIF